MPWPTLVWQAVFLMSVVACPAAADGHGGMGKAVTSLSRSLFAEVGSDRCIMVHFVGDKHAGPLGDDNEQVLIIDGTGLDKDVLERLNRWLKHESWCAVAVTTGQGDTLKAILDLIKPVSQKLVVVIGEVPPQMQGEATATKIAWLEQGLAGQIENTSNFSPSTLNQYSRPNMTYLTAKCPTIKPTAWSMQRRVNMWKKGHSTFAIQQPLLISCKNPMYGQELVLLHGNGHRQIIYSIDTGLPKGGRVLKMFQLFAKVFQFSLQTRLASADSYNISTNKWGGKMGLIIDGSGFGGLTFLVQATAAAIDVTVPHDLSELVFVSRKPIPVDTYDNLIKPFSPGVWAASYTSLIALGAMSLFAYQIYTSNSETQGLIKQESSYINFFLYPLVKITEPEALPWFPKWSTGKILVFQWDMLCLFLVMFYSCNLLAYMTAVEMEKPLDTLEDILEFGDTPYIYAASILFMKSYQEAIGRKDSIYYKIADLAEKTGGFYDFAKEDFAIALKRYRHLLESRSSLLMPKNNMPLNHLDSQGALNKQNSYAGKEVAEALYEGMAVQKYSPATPYLNKVIMRGVESGLAMKYLIDTVPIEEAVDMDVKRLPFAMTLKTLSFTLILYASGMVIAVITYVIEAGMTTFPRKIPLSF